MAPVWYPRAQRTRRVFMKFALFNGMGSTTWSEVLDLWRHVDATGWDAACVTDHFMPNTKDRVGDTMECWTTLAALAAETRRIRVGTIVSGNTYRHPAVLAKMAAGIDIISHGRLIGGIGAGGQENEHEAYGIPFYTVGERLARLDEACEVLKRLWTEKKATGKGNDYGVDDAPLEPKPIQRPYPELMVGGGGEKVTLKIAAKHADHWNVWGGPARLGAGGKILEGHGGRVGARSARARSPPRAPITGTCGAARPRWPRRARSSRGTARRSGATRRRSCARRGWGSRCRTTPPG